jgi:hypothetical protein
MQFHGHYESHQLGGRTDLPTGVLGGLEAKCRRQVWNYGVEIEAVHESVSD